MSTIEVEGNSNKELKEILAKKYQELFRQNLSLLEVVFPHEKGDNSENEKTFNSLRSKILRAGNDAVRDLDSIFDSFVTFKLYEYIKRETPGIQTIIIDFRNKYKINGKGGADGQGNK